jgi:hypothetical protein
MLLKLKSQANIDAHQVNPGFRSLLSEVDSVFIIKKTPVCSALGACQDSIRENVQKVKYYDFIVDVHLGRSSLK